MLQPGQKVTLTYHEGGESWESPGWTVVEYDNGLLKASRREETTIWNLRSVVFFKVDIEPAESSP
jgi:hypothetical protein